MSPPSVVTGIGCWSGAPTGLICWKSLSTTTWFTAFLLKKPAAALPTVPYPSTMIRSLSDVSPTNLSSVSKCSLVPASMSTMSSGIRVAA